MRRVISQPASEFLRRETSWNTDDCDDEPNQRNHTKEEEERVPDRARNVETPLIEVGSCKRQRDSKDDSRRGDPRSPGLQLSEVAIETEDDLVLSHTNDSLIDIDGHFGDIDLGGHFLLTNSVPFVRRHH